jgi:enamine deaminase RidA (YjgF/YER057c/UK114 family)
VTGAPVRRIVSPGVPEPPPGLFSNCLVVGDTVHVSGQHAGLPGGGIAGEGSVLEQTRASLRKIVALVEAAGGEAADIVKLTVYLTEMDRKVEVSAARREFFREPLPCSTLVGVNALVDPGLLVEIDAIAVLGAGGRVRSA